MDCTVGIISRNLVTQLNFVKFRYSRNFTYLEAIGVERHMACHVSTCMALLKSIYMRSQIQFVGGGEQASVRGSSKEKEEGGKREREERRN